MSTDGCATSRLYRASAWSKRVGSANSAERHAACCGFFKDHSFMALCSVNVSKSSLAVAAATSETSANNAVMSRFAVVTGAGSGGNADSGSSAAPPPSRAPRKSVTIPASPKTRASCSPNAPVRNTHTFGATPNGRALHGARAYLCSASACCTNPLATRPFSALHSIQYAPPRATTSTSHTSSSVSLAWAEGGRVAKRLRTAVTSGKKLAQSNSS
mmetsp:Transcript_12366/g.46125  ORF Transcript_12366/g.46125 Transcript_12366/m.46125 type:complete len:215 (+) Transcript_12366:347-991(+)